MMRLKKILLGAIFLTLMTVTGTANAYDLKEISLNEFDNVWFGNAQDNEAKTGVTVAIFPKGVRCGVDISGGGPASRETPVISPTTAPTPVNAIVLSGGSAYGLAASDGVMNWLRHRRGTCPHRRAKLHLRFGLRQFENSSRCGDGACGVRGGLSARKIFKRRGRRGHGRDCR